MNYFQRYAEAVLLNGYGISLFNPGKKTPVTGLEWANHGWELPGVDWVRKYAETMPDAGVGIVCGRFTVAFDFDTPSAKTNKRFVDLAKEIFGPTPLHRVGQAPKIAVIYRAAEPIISLRIPKIDILGLHTHFVAYGTHPATKEPYKWVGEGAPHDTNVQELPTATNQQIEEMMTQIAKETLGPDFREFQLGLDQNFMPLVLSSRTVLLKQLGRRIFRGKAYTRVKAAQMLKTKIPAGCWGLALKPISDAPIDWGGNFPKDD